MNINVKIGEAITCYLYTDAGRAPSVERRSHNPKVPSSILGLRICARFVPPCSREHGDVCYVCPGDAA